MWASFLIFLNALPVIWKFWGEFKIVFQEIKKFKTKQDIIKFKKNLKLASGEADNSNDTSGYEDIISNGRKK